jgi:hypothetical protein
VFEVFSFFYPLHRQSQKVTLSSPGSPKIPEVFAREGVFPCEQIFGISITNSDAKQVPVRYIGEQHLEEDLGRIPTAQDWLSQIKPARWMYGHRLDQDDSGAR